LVDAAYLVPLAPLAGFAFLVAFGARLRGAVAGWVGTAAAAASFLAAVVTFVGLVGEDSHARSFTQTLFTWVPVGDLQVDAALLVDPLSVTMALFVTGVGTLIHLYSIGYMHGDARYARFFTYLNLFMFSMLVLVLADNFLLSFLGWEGVGLCSYLLISFWFEREKAAAAGKKAFVTNRIGDFGFMLAMFLLFGAVGSLQYATVLGDAESLGRTTATAAALLLFLGAVGKSAQLPLYVWLPDAMEGPTPVSALIHAATMVTAGVYLMARVAPLLAQADTGVLTVIAVVGGVTALFAATIACAQDDIKRVLAYSTISQLGYMFLAVGSGAYVAAIFHMVTHAFFKALLFLGAGSVIHGLHEEQDMKHMGALRRFMPVTWLTFAVGWLAIAGVPPLSGFWSKDEILLAAWDRGSIYWALGLATALLTAYYMSRQVFLVFFGDARWREPEDPAATESHHAEPHEAPWTMAAPLVLLAGLAVVGGTLNLPFTSGTLVLEHWLEPVFGEALHHVAQPTSTKVALAVIAAGTAIAGVLAGYLAWYRRPENPALEPAVLERAWGVDELVTATAGGPVRAGADWLANFFDKRIVDGAVNGVATVVRASGTQLRKTQTGYVRNYALGITGGTVLLLVYVVVRLAA
jgi:NADH-quinone oxidoreductase subunit L